MVSIESDSIREVASQPSQVTPIRGASSPESKASPGLKDHAHIHILSAAGCAHTRVTRCPYTTYRELSTITKWATAWPASSSNSMSR